MAYRDIEHDAITPPDEPTSPHSSSESSESLESIDERVALLGPDVKGSSSPNYKSTSIITTASEEDTGSISDKITSKSVSAIISLLLVGVFISHADGTLVLSTYTTIASEFSALGDASWLTTSFTLALCAVQPITGKLSDIYGRKGVLLVSYALFAVGSIVCGIGQTFWHVIAGRIICGIGGAGMGVIVSVLIVDLVPLRNVATWRSYVNVVSTLGRSIGGPIGGFLADTIGWRWSFAGQGPLMLVAIILVAIGLPSSAGASDTPPPPKGHPSKLRRIDFPGAFLLATTILCLLGGLSLGGQNLPWTHPLVLGLLASSVILGALFVVFEIYCTEEPIFPPQLLVMRDVAAPYAIMALQSISQPSMMYTVPLYFRVTQNSSNTVAGSHLFPAVIGNTVGGLLAGFVIQKTGKYKFLTILSSISSMTAYLLLIFRWKGNTSWLESMAIVPGGFGTGIAFSAAFIAMTSSVKRTDIAIATSGGYLVSAIGMLIGIASTSAVQLASLRLILENGLGGIEGSKILIEKAISDVSSIANLEEGLKKIVIDGYVKSLEYSHMVSLGSSVLTLIIACTIRERPLK